MKITIESTDQVTHMDGVRVRVWNGVTEHGARCLVMIHRLVVDPNQNAEQFDRELREQLPPGRVIDLRHIL
jgi:hypothetical protein